jgi:hypothetical protein
MARLIGIANGSRLGPNAKTYCGLLYFLIVILSAIPVGYQIGV